MNNANMGQLPAHANAYRAKAGNGAYGAKEGYSAGMAGGDYNNQTCHFPAAAPARCYCQPAAFTSLNGRSHHRILDAYGQSRPCSDRY